MKTFCQNIFLHSLKKIYITFLFSLAAYLGYSQVSFGIKSGINIATTKDLITFPKNRMGWYIGGLSHISLQNKFFLQSELLFSSKGYRYNDLSDGKFVTMRLNYLDIPILLGYEIDRKTKIVSGLEFGYLMKAINYFNKENIDATNSFPQRFELDLDIGASYNIKEYLGIEIRYNYGFKNLYQTDEVGLPRGEFKGANRVFQIGIYYIIK